jgi:hypothetical protein
LTITEFLLARIAEDEATVTRRGPYPHSWHAMDKVGTFNPGCPDCIGFGGINRVLAECGAKRAIIEQAVHCNTNYGGTVTGAVSRSCYLTVLTDLATVYADHPDYQQDWAL